ncbi:MAG: conjugative transposon protein TraM, partial [Sphingobacteriales bacterium]
MMTIDFKQPRYVLPVVVLPFLLLLFYAFKSASFNGAGKSAPADSLQTALAGVSPEVQSKSIGGKLDAFRDRFRAADGYTAVNGPGEESETPQQEPPGLYSEREKYMLDSIAKRMKEKSGEMLNADASAARYRQRGSYSPDADRSDPADEALRKALSEINREKPADRGKPAEDPMQLFRAQLSLIDSLSKANDPSAKLRPPLTKGSGIDKGAEQTLRVRKADPAETSFTTIRTDENPALIPAMLDEELTVYSGSRLRIRLLEDIMAGPYLLPKQSYLYAQVSGFSAQRVLLSVNSAFVQGEILPLKLEIRTRSTLQPRPTLKPISKCFLEKRRLILQSSSTKGKRFHTPMALLALTP